jgi:hypothetical protein
MKLGAIRVDTPASALIPAPDERSASKSSSPDFDDFIYPIAPELMVRPRILLNHRFAKV